MTNNPENRGGGSEGGSGDDGEISFLDCILSKLGGKLEDEEMQQRISEASDSFAELQGGMIASAQKGGLTADDYFTGKGFGYIANSVLLKITKRFSIKSFTSFS